MIEVDIYPVGWLAAWQRRHLRTYRRCFWRWVQRGDWRAVRNSFNGYLAEHPGPGCHHDAGRGWTQNLAARRVGKICLKSGS